MDCLSSPIGVLRPPSTCPPTSPPCSSRQLVDIDPRDLEAALKRDAAKEAVPAGAPAMQAAMTDQPINLDRRRGMAAQKLTEIRRLLAEVEANEQALRDRQQELETQLLTAPATCWPEVAEKARYLLKLLAAAPVAQDPRRQELIANVFNDFERLTRNGGGDSATSEAAHASPPPSIP